MTLLWFHVEFSYIIRSVLIYDEFFWKTYFENSQKWFTYLRHIFKRHYTSIHLKHFVNFYVFRSDERERLKVRLRVQPRVCAPHHSHDSIKEYIIHRTLRTRLSCDLCFENIRKQVCGRLHGN